MGRKRSARRIATAVALSVAAVLAAPMRAQADWQRIELSGMPGVAQPILYQSASSPVASVILFVGGDGKLGDDDGSFLLRVKGRFVAAGMSVAVPDTPLDHPGGFGPYFRTWAAATEDTAAVVAFLKGQAPVPVWVVGTSNGTISAANAAARLGVRSIAGVVMTSAVWLDALRLVPVGEIAVPVLLMQDSRDACPVSKPPLSAQNIARFTEAPAKKLVVIAGVKGKDPLCGNDSAHDFYGVDNAAVGPIIDWIKAYNDPNPSR